MATFIKKTLKSFLLKWKSKVILIFFVFSLGVFAFNIYQIDIVKEKFPRLDLYLRSQKYRLLAKKYPAGDIKSIRLRAIADSLEKGSKNYSFETGSMPSMGQ